LNEELAQPIELSRRQFADRPEAAPTRIRAFEVNQFFSEVMKEGVALRISNIHASAELDQSSSNR
jgi:hypothetical protein